MEILIEKEYLYASSKGTDSTDYCRQQLKQCGRCLHAPEGWLQGHPAGAHGGRTGRGTGLKRESRPGCAGRYPR